ncbi:MAG: hypothetical protein JRN68_09580 [Nitrososphaerota archaeon]|nr:hypothetical protein [Nitrososphaerota archaeon]
MMKELTSRKRPATLRDRSTDVKTRKGSVTVVFKLGRKMLGCMKAKDAAEADRWSKGWTRYGILPPGIPSYGISGICPKCGRKDLGSKINARVCAGCAWSFGLCRCTPLNYVPTCMSCNRPLPGIGTYCPYCGAKQETDELLWMHPHKIPPIMSGRRL